MDTQDLGYALTQVVHNLGAVSVTGGAAAACVLNFANPQAAQRSLAALVLAGWAAQALSGVCFATISYLSYGHLPDIHGIAVAALTLKATCASAGFSLGVLYLWREVRWPERRRRNTWNVQLVLALTALTAAAFLRWFS